MPDIQDGRPIVSLPLTTFLYTLEQIAAMLNLPFDEVRHKYVYYLGMSSGRKPTHQLMAINIGPDNDDPEWRVSEEHFIRWLKARGFEVRTDNRL